MVQTVSVLLAILCSGGLFCVDYIKEGSRAMAEDRYDVAYMMYEKAAKQGNPDAYYNIGGMFFNGQGFKKDYDVALKWFLKGSKAGHARSSFMAANMYENATGGVEQSYDKALGLYELSAEQGLKRSYCNLGRMYAEGWGVEKDLEKAADLLLMAAKEKEKNKYCQAVWHKFKLDMYMN
ncbi:tetratricopeptide repeat protein [Limisalsivibrio acetivorans]|uniref:tetratricopeptide repeat protein n=1 Tax=Limisalsivibrio acetivorans TaxID=1304888 RepID=UPI0009DC3693|nr:tetratricopeptide repeat protein [Limisalsivibrio acetivorans]